MKYPVKYNEHTTLDVKSNATSNNKKKSSTPILLNFQSKSGYGSTCPMCTIKILYTIFLKLAEDGVHEVKRPRWSHSHIYEKKNIEVGR